MIHPIDSSLLPSGPPPVPRPLQAAVPPARVEKDRVGVVTTAPEMVTSMLPAVEDDPGRMVIVDERMLTEAMFFRFGFERMSYGKMAEVLHATIRWVTKTIGREPWLMEAYNQGLAIRGQEVVVSAEESLTRLIEGYELDKQKVTKDGDVVDYKEVVGPNERATTFGLERLAKAKYGKDAAPPPRTVNVQVVMGVNERLAAAGEQGITVQVRE